MCGQPITGVKHKVSRKTQSRNTANMVAERGLSSFPLLLVVVLAEHGGCLSSIDATVGCESGASAKLVGTSVRLVAGCRWNE